MLLGIRSFGHRHRLPTTFPGRFISSDALEERGQVSEMQRRGDLLNATLPLATPQVQRLAKPAQ